MKVVCRSCHREERWNGAHEVILEGGRRRPTQHPTLMAWNTLRTAHEAGLVAVGTCVCGQPLIGEGPRIPWTLTVPDGTIEVGATLASSRGPQTPEQVSTWVEGHHRARLLDDIEPTQTVMQLVLMTPLLAPFLLWLFTMSLVTTFLYAFAQRPGFR